jgi:phosphoglycolate phosphatase-like HAD superfamily hydrolase
MEFIGKALSGIIHTDNFSGHFFGRNEKILVFDIDGVLIQQKKTERNGRRGQDRYDLNPQARGILKRAKKDHLDRIVLWTYNPFSIEKLFGMASEFADVDLCLAGPSGYEGETGVKDLRILTPNLSNVLALEDDRHFRPRGRVLYVGISPKNRLMQRYSQAVVRFKK